MINLFYHSHTVVPAHLEELVSLKMLEPDEQVLVAIDGVLLDHNGRRLSGPTLHDYCLLTTLRVLLWARDYGNHVCYAFPLTELSVVEGIGLDPLHAQLQLTFVAPNEPEQRFTFALVPLCDVQPAVTLLHLAAEAAQEFVASGMELQQAGPDIAAVLSARVFGTPDGVPPPETPYRWPGAASRPNQIDPAFQPDPSTLPPEQFYAAGRIARSAWDTLRRTLRDAELPFDMSGNNLRDLADTVRAVNDLINTIAADPNARDMAMAFLSRRKERGQGAAERDPRVTPQAGAAERPAAAGEAAQPPEYHEIPLRKRQPGQPDDAQPEVAPPPPVQFPDRTEIPVRRRGEASRPRSPVGRTVMASGSGDATKGS